MWERLESSVEEIKEAWCNVPNRDGLGGIVDALKHVQVALRSWSKANFGSMTEELNSLRVQLEAVKGDTSATRADQCAVTDRMDELLYREEMMWLQRSQIAWLREGDTNPSYFHRQAVWRARKNKFKKLKRDDGSWYEDSNELKSMARDFFRTLYDKDPGVDPSHLLDLIVLKVSEDMNEALCSEFSVQEISDALF